MQDARFRDDDGTSVEPGPQQKRLEIQQARVLLSENKTLYREITNCSHSTAGLLKESTAQSL